MSETESVKLQYIPHIQLKTAIFNIETTANVSNMTKLPTNPYVNMSFVEKLGDKLPYSKILYSEMAKKYSPMLPNFLLLVDNTRRRYLCYLSN